jgi:hypothetical protein
MGGFPGRCDYLLSKQALGYCSGSDGRMQGACPQESYGGGRSKLVRALFLPGEASG